MILAISSQGLTKDYGGGRGLFDLDLQVVSGEVLGFLGPNGAGKTTTIRLLMAMIHPTRGWARIFDLDCQAQAVEIKRRVGYLPGELPQFGGLRGKEIVAHLSGLRGGDYGKRVAATAERLQLDLNQRFREYSRGHKQKLGLVLAFMHDPDLLVLDEPTVGLDPLNQQEFYEMVREARARGAAVFLSSHVLSEVEHVCDRVGIIRKGRLARVAPLAELHDIRVHRIEVQFAEPVPRDILAGVPDIDQVEIKGNRLTCTVKGSVELFWAALSKRRIVNLVSHEPSLEDVFLTYYRDDEEGAAAKATT